MQLANETVVSLEVAPLKFGVGATDEVGYDLKRLGVSKVLVLTDKHILATGLPDRVQKLIKEEGIQVELYDATAVEPTDKSLEAAAQWALAGNYDGFVSVGGGSTIDTAKVVNLLTTYPAPIMDYINKPIGKAVPIPGRLKPHIAIPTTAGTGSEGTPVAVLDVLDLRLKTGISHAYLRPSLGIVDPMNTITMPAAVTAATGFDVLTHALESYTARPYTARPRYASPAERPAYQGSNPISDLWSEQAIRYMGQYLRRAYLNGWDLEARTYMSLAASAAGIGLGSAGVHIPHAAGYPLAGRVREYVPQGYDTDHPMVPHGISVVMTAPSAFRFTYATSPERHLHAAELLGISTKGMSLEEGREALPRAIIQLMRDCNVPNGVSSLGYAKKDIPDLVEGTMKQQRLLAVCPRDVTADIIEEIFDSSLSYW
ncbi:MAG: hydroxyacid-oxoacid transhydrogenase [Ktedonobacteraceae bacterium]